MSSATDNQVKVGIRIRPLLESEKVTANASGSSNKTAQETTPIWCQQGKVTIGADSRSRSTFNFDWASDASTATKSIYTNMCADLIEKPYLGYNATFFAYGQTGSGKTFTMGNAPDSIEGVIPFAVRDIFRLQQAYLAQGDHITLHISYLEIYLEECFDLLSSNNEKKKVEVRENQLGAVIVEGLTQRLITDEEQVKEFIKMALKRRSTSKTAMNADSSRSHAICTFTIQRTITSSTGASSTPLIGRLNLVDLAGSERASKTKAAGEVFQEGININKGLLALSNVVSALSAVHKKDGNMTGIHIPYRESKLTRLLKDSLGGNGFTVLLACVSPAMSNYDETLNTLRFAARASNVTNSAKINLQATAAAASDSSHAGTTAAAMLALREELALMHMQNQTLRNTIHDIKQHQTDEAEVTKEESSTYQLHCFTLTASYKALLLHCFNEGIEIDDSILSNIVDEVTGINTSLSSARTTAACTEDDDSVMMMMMNESFCAEFQAEFGGENGMDMINMKEFMPPIMQVLDSLTALEGRLKGDLCLKTASSVVDTSSSSLALSMIEAVDDNEGDSNDHSLDLLEQEQGQASPAVKQVHQEEAIAAEIESKLLQLENKGMHYQHVIQTLHKEIQLLQTENVTLASSSTPAAPAAPTSTAAVSSINTASEQQQQAKLQRELKLKSKELEDKIKALHQREQEYTRILTSKEQLHQQLTDQRVILQQCKVDKVKLTQTIKEVSIAHRTETKALQQSEIRSKLLAHKAEAKIGKLGIQLTLKEKAWQSRLASQIREKEKLTQLLQKRENVKEMTEKTRSLLRNRFQPRTINKSINTELSSLLLDSAVVAIANKQKAELLFLQDTKKLWLDKRMTLRDELRSLRANSRTARKHEHMIKTCSNKIATLAKDILWLQLQATEGAMTSANTTAQLKAVLSGEGVEEQSKVFIMSLWSKYNQLQVDKHHLTFKLQRSIDSEFEAMLADTESGRGDGVDDDGSVQEMDETFYPSSEDDDNEEEDDNHQGRRRKAVAAPVVSKHRTSNDSSNTNDTNDDASDSDDDDDSDEADNSFGSNNNKKRGKKQSNKTKMPAKRSRKSDDDQPQDDSMPSIDDDAVMSTEAGSKRRTKAAPKFIFSDSPDSALSAYITSSQASSEDCLLDAMKLYQEMPEGFVIASYTHSKDKMEIVTSMIFKRAFPEALKGKLNGSSIKRRDEQWTQMKNDLALLFAAFICKEKMQHDMDGSGSIVCVPLASYSTEPLNELQPFLENMIISHKAVKIESEKPRDKEGGSSGNVGGVNWNKFTIKELKGFLSDRGLPVSGTKPVLVDRLTQHEANTFKPVAVASLTMDVSEEDTAVEGEDENKAPEVVNMQQLKPRRSLKFDLDELMKDIDNNRTARKTEDSMMMMEE